MNNTNILRENGFINYMKVLSVIAFPIVIQNLITSCLGIIDALMVGQIGQNEIAAVGIVNQYISFFSFLVLGLGSGCGIFVAQFYGVRDMQSIQKTISLSFLIGGIASLVFSIGSIVLAQPILKIFSEDGAVLALGDSFIKLIALSMIPFTVSCVFAAAIRSVNYPKIPMVASVTALLLNTVLNAILIYGMFGLEPLGVTGAGIATLVARVAEMLIMLMMIRKKDKNMFASFVGLALIRKKFATKFAKMFMPIIVSDGLWGLAGTLCVVFIAKMGTEAMVVIQILSNVQGIIFAIIGGIAAAVGILIGNEVGKGERDRSMVYANYSIVITIVIGVIHAVALYVTAPYIGMLFNISHETYEVTVTVLQLFSIPIIVKFFNFVSCIGIMRSGGDVNYVMKLELLTMWFISVPLVYLGVIVWGLSLPTVIMLMAVEEFVKVMFEYRRMKSRKWINVLTEEISGRQQDSMSV
ncbi:MATE family efflux transporter [Pseudogracilibacillus auburnensis]|uniref:MATE family efflux transporter n=1 Tax=Pseudogracilibacillus auburnensis TaxID=1494959 RepID=UPI001A95A705|nr:MATE family efflux transporter [Pseudogracilibacillus auburnensis]MBO1004761.1 MATE family efflux transporter [Pseudogracilibacillus auburnensis]